jgi:nucleotide-binding universal stress UspA family protein
MSDGPVLICFDGSEVATEAIRLAGALVSTREAVVLSVAVPAKDETHFNPVGDLVGKLSKLYKEWNVYVRELAEQQAQAGVAIAAAAGFEARPLAMMGRPAETILRAASEQGASAIVIGSRGHTMVGGVLGSVSARVVADATVPVVVVPKH